MKINSFKAFAKSSRDSQKGMPRACEAASSRDWEQIHEKTRDKLEVGVWNFGCERAKSCGGSIQT